MLRRLLFNSVKSMFKAARMQQNSIHLVKVSYPDFKAARMQRTNQRLIFQLNYVFKAARMQGTVIS
jgi:hypothetical protein